MNEKPKTKQTIILLRFCNLPAHYKQLDFMKTLVSVGAIVKCLLMPYRIQAIRAISERLIAYNSFVCVQRNTYTIDMLI